MVWRNVGRHEEHLAERVAADGGLREREVSAMDGVETAAEEADVHSIISCRCFLPLFPVMLR